MQPPADLQQRRLVSQSLLCTTAYLQAVMQMVENPNSYHIEIFSKDYEYERYIVRTRSLQQRTTVPLWNKPSKLGGVFRVPHVFEHEPPRTDGGCSIEQENLSDTTRTLTDFGKEQDKLEKKWQGKVKRAGDVNLALGIESTPDTAANPGDQEWDLL